MLRGTASKVMWVGRATVFLVGLAVILGLLFGAANAAFAGNGDNWILGRFGNTATKITGLTASPPSGQAALAVANSANGPAIAVRTANGQAAPIRTNSDARNPNLNADLVDGNGAGAFLGSDTVIRTSNNNLPGGTTVAADTAQCEDGEVATGGGAALVLDGAGEGAQPVNGEFVIASSRPTNLGGAAGDPPVAWRADIFDFDTDAAENGAFTLRVYAVCTNVGATTP